MDSPSDGVARSAAAAAAAAAAASDDPEPHPPPSASSAPPPPPRRRIVVVPRRVVIRRRGGVKSSSSSSSSSNQANHDENDDDDGGGGGGRGGDGIPPHVRNNAELHHAISTTLPRDYEFEIPKTIVRIEKSNAVDVALQMPEGLAMYASAIGDILVRFCHRFRPTIHHHSRRRVVDGEGKEEEEEEGGGGTSVVVVPKRLHSLSVLGDVTYGACCVDDLSAKSLGCDLLVHYGHSCLVPVNRTALPCLYVFVEISVDVGHLVDCVRMTFEGEEEERERGRGTTGASTKMGGGGAGGGEKERRGPPFVVEACVMGTVQFRSAVVEAARALDDDDREEGDDDDDRMRRRRRASSRVRFRTIVPQAKPLSPGEVLGCTSPSGLATLDFDAGARAASSRRRKGRAAGGAGGDPAENGNEDILPVVIAEEEGGGRERVMIFVADGRFHLEAAMMSNPTLRALRYDPYSKTLTEERYETSKMKGLRRDAVIEARRLLGLSSSSSSSSSRADLVVAVGRGAVAPSVECGDDVADRVLRRPPRSRSPHRPPGAGCGTMGIILGTLGRQGNPAILSRVRSLLRSRGVRTSIVLLSEVFPAKLDAMSSGPGGIRAWVQIACPRLSVDWGHHFSVPVLSPYELFVALGEVDDSSLLGRHGGGANELEEDEEVGYPMDFYSKSGGPWANYHEDNKDRKVASHGS